MRHCVTWTSALHVDLHESKFSDSVSRMPDHPVGQPGPNPKKVPFASWLDSIVPAVIPSDAEFARRLGVDQSYVHRWRRGVRPQVPALMKISKVTGTSVETLLLIAGYVDETEGK